MSWGEAATVSGGTLNTRGVGSGGDTRGVSVWVNSVYQNQVGPSQRSLLEKNNFRIRTYKFG